MNIEQSKIDEESCVNVEYRIRDEIMPIFIGVARVREYEGEVAIDLINVNPNRRGEGIGTKLLEKIVNDYDNHLLTVTTFPYLEEWYEEFGFKKTYKKGNLIHMVREPRM
ncbi:MAG: GNAT family N-acetyltransferase [Candidatus Hydrothermarchaeota archaeon]